MTKKEAIRQTEQARALMATGFTAAEAEALRRISVQLQRWYEYECGDDRRCLVRGQWEDGEFTYDDAGDPYWEYAGVSGRWRYQRTRDLEKGAMHRLQAIMAAHNDRPSDSENTQDLTYYLQTDPRGAALYIIRPGDVPEGKDIDSYYTRGICVY